MRHSVRMLRRAATLFAVLIMVSVALTALAPRRERAGEDRSTTPATVTTTPARAKVTDAVRGRLPRDRIVRARVGDNVELTVTATEPDSVTIDGLGLMNAAGPDAPAQFSFRADRVGTFVVMLTLSERRAGRVVVRAARRSPASR